MLFAKFGPMLEKYRQSLLAISKGSVMSWLSYVKTEQGLALLCFVYYLIEVFKCLFNIGFVLRYFRIVVEFLATLIIRTSLFLYFL